MRGTRPFGAPPATNTPAIPPPSRGRSPGGQSARIVRTRTSTEVDLCRRRRYAREVAKSSGQLASTSTVQIATQSRGDRPHRPMRGRRFRQVTKATPISRVLAPGDRTNSDRAQRRGQTPATPPERISLFQRVANKVSYGVGTPTNIAIWIVLVVGWTLLFAVGGGRITSGTWLPAWFRSTGSNFPLNLVTTVAELYIGFLVGASSNRSERNLEATLANLEAQERQIRDVEFRLTECPTSRALRMQRPTAQLACMFMRFQRIPSRAL